MNNRFRNFFIAVSLLVFVACISLFFINLSKVRDDNLSRARGILLRESGINSLGSPPQSYFANISGDKSIRLRVFSIYSSSIGIEELWAYSPEYISELPEDIGLLRSEPYFKFNDIYEEKITLITEGSEKRLIAIVNVINSEDLFALLLPLMYILLGFAVFTLLFLVVKSISDSQNIGEDGIEYRGQPLRSEPAMDAETAEDPLENINTVNDGLSTAEKNNPAQSIQQSENASTAKPKDSSVKPTGERHRNGFSLGENQIWPADLLKLRLNNEIERSAENESDIGFVIFRLGKSFRNNDAGIKSFESLLIENFRYEDLIFQLDPMYYGIILPNRGQDESLKQIEHFQIIMSQKLVGNDDVFAGFSTRSGRLMGGDRLLKESLKAASIASPKKGRIISFKPDPQKYKSHLMGTG